MTIFFLKALLSSSEMKRGQKGWECTKQYCSGPGKGGVEKLTSDWEIGPATSTQGQDVRPWDWTRREVAATETFHEAGTLKCYSLSVKEPDKVHVSTQACSSETCLCPRIWVSKEQFPTPVKLQAHATPRYGVWTSHFLGYGIPNLRLDIGIASWANSEFLSAKQMQNFSSSKSTGNTIRNSCSLFSHRRKIKLLKIRFAIAVESLSRARLWPHEL